MRECAGVSCIEQENTVPLETLQAATTPISIAITTNSATNTNQPAPQPAPPSPRCLLLRWWCSSPVVLAAVRDPGAMRRGGGGPSSLTVGTVFSPIRLWLVGGGDRKANNRKLNFGHVRKADTQSKNTERQTLNGFPQFVT